VLAIPRCIPKGQRAGTDRAMPPYLPHLQMLARGSDGSGSGYAGRRPRGRRRIGGWGDILPPPPWLCAFILGVCLGMYLSLSVCIPYVRMGTGAQQQQQQQQQRLMFGGDEGDDEAR